MELYKHQIEALEDTKDFNKVAYFFGMGCGKTFIGSEKMKSLGMHNHALVICQKSKIIDWYNHFEEFYRYDAPVLDLTEKKDFENFFKAPTGCVGIINYELAWRRPELLKLKNFTLMLDESSLIQNSKAKQTKFVLKLKPDNVILLSGTPCSGKYENLWSQCRLLGWDIKESSFQSTYVNWTMLDLGFKKVPAINKSNPYKNVDRLKRKLYEHGARFKQTEECVDLPDQVFTDIRVPVTKAYKKFMKDSLVDVDGTEFVGDTTLTKLLYARMLCGTYNADKLNALNDLIQSTNDRLIVFYNFNIELEALKKICEEHGRPVSEVNGHVKDLTAYEQESDSITLCQYSAASKGLNLQKCNTIIYFTPTNKVEDWMQSQRRTLRIGQKRTCFYYTLTCIGSVEERVYLALKRGEDYTNDLFRKEVIGD